MTIPAPATAHKFGNWTLKPEEKRLYVLSDNPNDGWSDQDNVDAYGGVLVCESLNSDRAARLIAAAPALVAALQGMVAWAKANGAEATGSERYAAARAALSLALGEQ